MKTHVEQISDAALHFGGLQCFVPGKNWNIAFSFITLKAAIAFMDYCIAKFDFVKEYSVPTDYLPSSNCVAVKFNNLFSLEN